METDRAEVDELPPRWLPPGMAAMLERARGGDRPAFRQLVMGCQARVYSAALRLTGNRADAEELAQDAFVQLHAALPQIVDAAHLGKWLLRTIYYRSIDRIRQRERQGEKLPLEVLDRDPAGHVPTEGGDPMAAARLDGLLMQLQPDARAVLLLRFQDDLDPTEIAEVLGMPINTVKSHLRRSLQWLRDQCSGESHGY